MNDTSRNKNRKGAALAWIVALAAVVVVVALVARGLGNRAERSRTDGASSVPSVLGDTPDGQQPGQGTDSSSSPADITHQKDASSSPSMHYTQATLHTSMGDITIALDTANTPHTVENFVKLASSGFYDGTKFHRVIEGFMIQGGDPLSKDDGKEALWGTGGPGYSFADEIKPTNSDVKGTIAMANAGPNTNGSQFFINVADNTYLNTKHTVFGHVTAGYDIVEKISQVATDSSDRPVTPVVISSIDLK